MGKIAVDRFVGGGGGPLSPLFTSSASYADAQQRAQLSNVALDNGNGDADKLQSLVDDLNAQRKDLEDKQREQADLIASLDAKRKQGDQLQAEYQDKLTAATAKLGDLVRQEQERRAAEAVADATARSEAMQKAAADQQAKAAAVVVQPVSRGGGEAPTAAPASPTTDAASPPADSPPATSAGRQPPAGTRRPRTRRRRRRPRRPPSTPTTEAPAPRADPTPPPPSSRASIAVDAAMGQRGVAYRFAAESPGVAFDCSGLTKYAWGQAGVYLPHQSAQQYASTPHVSQSDAQPGDLVFYHSPISHVALYIGGGNMVEAPRPGDVVHVRPVNWGNVVGVSRPG